MEESNRELQRELYGEPLADILGRIMSSLGLTQGRLAKVLGLSAPMLSQLISGARAKIGNPAVLSRLQNLTELGQAAPGLSSAAIEERLEAIADAQLTMTSMRTAHSATLDALRAAATASELERVASFTVAPGLAALLRQAAQASPGPAHG